MILFDKIVQLSNYIASALLRNEKPKEFLESDLINESDKKYVLENLTDPDKINLRNQLLKQINAKKDWKKIQKKINAPVYYLNFVKYAATIALLLGLGYYFYSNQNNTIIPATNNVVKVESINPGTDKATLVLGNGKTILLGQGNNYNSNGIAATNNSVIYNENQNSKIEYNYLTIPRGGQFQLQLADGTKVWINSQSQLKFPNHFIAGKTRNVELMYGEAYFEVSPSTAHQGAHFNVKVKSQEVEVLGTQFNIKAYDNENYLYTTLVEGKVKLVYGKQVVTLKPNDQSTVNESNNSIQTKSIDVYNAIAWKDGIFSFQNMPLIELVKVLERWYDVEIVIKNKTTQNIQFTGTVNKKLKIEEILNLINKTNNVTYEINKKKITLE